MQDATLYRLAAVIYKERIQAPAHDAGLWAPEIRWKDLRSHYRFHAYMPNVQRMTGLRSMQAMRAHLEAGGLLRVDPISEAAAASSGNFLPPRDDDGNVVPVDRTAASIYRGRKHVELDKVAAKLYLDLVKTESHERALWTGAQCALHGTLGGDATPACGPKASKSCTTSPNTAGVATSEPRFDND